MAIHAQPSKTVANSISYDGFGFKNDAAILKSAATGIERTAQKLGCDANRLLSKYNVSSCCAEANTSAMALKDYTRLLQEASEVTREDHFGLIFGTEFNMADLGPNGYLMLYATTIGEAIERFAAHFSDLQEESTLSLNLHDDHAQLCYRIDDPRVRDRRQDAEFTISMLYSFFSQIFGDRWPVNRIEFAHTPLSSNPRHGAILDCPIEFRRAETALYMPRSVLDYKMPSPDPLLLRHIEEYFSAKRNTSRRDNQVTKLVTREVEIELDNGEQPRLEDIATIIGKSSRSLNRKLAAEGTSFREIVLDCRLQAADRALRDTDIPLKELAFMTGYSDETAFSRAFRRKHGVSPFVWRHNDRNDQD